MPSDRVLLVGCVIVAVLLGGCASRGAGPRYVRDTLCIGCHHLLNKDLVEQYQVTSHATTVPAAGTAAADAYRRTVGCQACHGPGSQHVRAKGQEQQIATIIGPHALTSTRQKLSLCGRCHGQYSVAGQPFAAGFTPGDDLLGTPGFQLAKPPRRGPFQELNECLQSPHPAHDVTCLGCHVSHRAPARQPLLRKALPGLCLDCHARPHAGSSAAERSRAAGDCIGCHMPGGSHTFRARQ